MNGDVISKEGTKHLSELAKHHKIHFHIAIPLQEDIYIYISPRWLEMHTITLSK